MRVWQITFFRVKKDGDKAFVFHKNDTLKTNKLVVGQDRTVILLETQLSKYWEYGADDYTPSSFISGYESMKYMGEMDDKMFSPVMSEAEFINNKIKSKKSGEVVGFQG